MKKMTSFFMILIICLCTYVPCYAAGGTELNISSKNIKHSISPLLYGVSMEDVSYACDGGLVAQLVNNGSFEYKGKGSTTWVYNNIFSEITNEYPMNDNNTMCLKLTLDGEGTVKNLGFSELFRYKTYNYNEEAGTKADMGFKQDESYAFSCYVKNIDFSGSISVYLDSKKNKSDVVQLSAQNIGTAEWTQLSTDLTSKATEDGGLAIELDGKGSILIDNVSLVPKSSYGYGTNQWKYVSLRDDLFKALKMLKPSFLRFPGGCLAEGKDINDLYNWKNTLGALEERKQSSNIWEDQDNGNNYNNTNSMGYHEYFQLCEDINASPIPVVNAALTCQKKNGYEDYCTAKQKLLMTDEQWEAYLINEKGFSKTDKKGINEYTDKIKSLGIKSDADFEKYIDTISLKPGTDAFTNYVQDVLDLIEYANGDALGTYWGALRAANGHAQPFNVEYIQLGNENEGDVYKRNFEAISSAIKKKYPKIKIIASVSEREDFSSGNCDIIDEHFDEKVDFFFENNEYFDSYDRAKASAMVGELRAEDSHGKMLTNSNIMSAVAEAGFMTGFERNSDVVRMSAAAPTLAKLNANSKESALIWFDSQDIILTPNYYNQMLFSNNTGAKYISASFGEDAKDLYQSVTVDENRQQMFVKIVNAGSSKKIDIKLDGFDDINAASVQTLTHKYKSASNQLEKQAVAPTQSELETLPSTIEFKTPSNSVNIIRIAYGGNNGESFYTLDETVDLKTKSYTPASAKLAAVIIATAFIIGFAIGYFIFFRKLKKK